MSQRVYINCLIAPGSVQIEGAEAHHLISVCRVRAGDPVSLFNGDGCEYPGIVQGITRRTVTVEVLRVETAHRELGYRLEVAVPLPKGDRGHFLLEKLTEIGVTHFVPLETERSVIHPGANRLEKLRRYVIEASKQSGRNILLQVKPVQPWKSYCLDFNLPPARILAHPGGQAGIITPGKDMAVALGPEGGFTDQEIAQASSSGWRVVGFGPRILRIETAAIVAAALGAGL